jgi:hypothetical protein
MSATRGREAQRVDERVVALNYAVLGVVDQILWLPSPPVALTAVRLLYGPDLGLPSPMAEHVGRGAPLALAPLVGRPRPLARLLPARLRLVAGGRERSMDLRGIRAIARRRYGDLQASFVASPAPAALDGSDALVRYTYGPRARWLREEATTRLLDRVAALNRAALSLLAAVGAGASQLADGDFGAQASREVAAEPIAAALAQALPPIAVPDFAHLAASLAPVEEAPDADESVERYRLLFGEMLGRAGRSERLA